MPSPNGADGRDGGLERLGELGLGLGGQAGGGISVLDPRPVAPEQAFVRLFCSGAFSMTDEFDYVSANDFSSILSINHFIDSPYLPDNA